MDPDTARVLAAAWWAARGGDEAWERVDALVAERGPDLPRVIRALVDTAPEGGIRYLGTVIVEDLVLQARIEGRAASDDLGVLRNAGLNAAELFELLAGAYATYLRELGVDRLGDVLSVEQLAWLLDDAAPDRWPSTGEGRPRV